MERKVQDYRNMLEDVVNELDLSEAAIEKHGPLGTPPAELVKLVLDEKDKEIVRLRSLIKLSMTLLSKSRQRGLNGKKATGLKRL